MDNSKCILQKLFFVLQYNTNTKLLTVCLRILETGTYVENYLLLSMVDHFVIFQDGAKDVQISLHQQQGN